MLAIHLKITMMGMKSLTGGLGYHMFFFFNIIITYVGQVDIYVYFSTLLVDSWVEQVRIS